MFRMTHMTAPKGLEACNGRMLWATREHQAAQEAREFP